MVSCCQAKCGRRPETKNTIYINAEKICNAMEKGGKYMFEKEDYVSLATAKMLKKKGYDEPCKSSRWKNGELRLYDKNQTWDNMTSLLGKDYYEFLCPTLYEAQKWLRTTYNIHLCVKCTAYIKRCKKHDYICEIMDLLHHQHKDTLIYHSYEQTLDAGIREALKLI